MTALTFPCAIFKTQKWMDNYSANDMRCGDLTETQLKSHYGLTDVSTKANPYTLTKITPFNQPQSLPYGSCGVSEKITDQECAKILFDEFRDLSGLFAMYGPYKSLIKKMITHMQKASGAPFQDMLLNSALTAQILNDNSKENSTRLRLESALNDEIDWENKCYPASQKDKLITAISRGKLPKFDRIQDNFNGMGIPCMIPGRHI